jgi:hypothetical protein
VITSCTTPAVAPITPAITAPTFRYSAMTGTNGMNAK